MKTWLNKPPPQEKKSLENSRAMLTLTAGIAKKLIEENSGKSLLEAAIQKGGQGHPNHVSAPNLKPEIQITSTLRADAPQSIIQEDKDEDRTTTRYGEFDAKPKGIRFNYHTLEPIKAKERRNGSLSPERNSSQPKNELPAVTKQTSPKYLPPPQTLGIDFMPPSTNVMTRNNLRPIDAASPRQQGWGFISPPSQEMLSSQNAQQMQSLTLQPGIPFITSLPSQPGSSYMADPSPQYGGRMNTGSEKHHNEESMDLNSPHGQPVVFGKSPRERQMDDSFEEFARQPINGVSNGFPGQYSLPHNYPQPPKTVGYLRSTKTKFGVKRNVVGTRGGYDDGYQSPLDGENQWSRNFMRNRARNFKVKPATRMNIFDGLPFVPYDEYVQQDNNIQVVVYRDVLKVLSDKFSSVKNRFLDRNRILDSVKNVTAIKQRYFNRLVEESLGLFQEIADIILDDFKDYIVFIEERYDREENNHGKDTKDGKGNKKDLKEDKDDKDKDKIKIRISPIRSKDLKVRDFSTELEIIQMNMDTFVAMHEHFKDCTDLFFIMSRQPERKPLTKEQSKSLLEYITRARYNCGAIIEQLVIHERNSDEKRNWMRTKAKEKEETTKKIQEEFLPRIVHNDYSTQQPLTMKDIRRKTSELDRKKALKSMMESKFNFTRRQNLTRESKINLNREQSDAKKISLMAREQENKLERKVADNRERITVERLTNPFKSPDV